MNLTGASQAQISSRAVEATIALSRRLGIGRVEPVVLHASEHVSIRLFPLDVVARVVVSPDGETINRVTRELNVARHLVENAAPIVGPSTELPAGPHVQEGSVVTLWEFVEHLAADEDNGEHIACAAKALQRVHQALSAFRGELPDFWSNIDHCRRLLENESALTTLHADDRAFCWRPSIIFVLR